VMTIASTLYQSFHIFHDESTKPTH
jgi:hypothetical protein